MKRNILADSVTCYTRNQKNLKSYQNKLSTSNYLVIVRSKNFV